MRHLFAILFLTFTSSLFAGTAMSVTGLYTTGINSTWLMNGGAGAYVISNSAVNNNHWVSNSSSARWISYAPSTKLPYGSYAYNLSFNINGDGGAGSSITNYVSLTLTWTSDDTSELYLNGTDTGIGQSGWTSTKTATIDSDNYNFGIGPNTLTVVVDNSGGGASGLMVTGISYKILPHSPVPEVGTWMIVVGSAAFVAWSRLRRKRA